MPPVGSIAIFKPVAGNPYGHIAIVDSASKTVLNVLEQNGGRGSGTGTGTDAIRVRNIGYSNIAGFLIPKQNNEGDKKMTYDDWIMYNWYRLLEEDFPSQSEFDKAIQDNARYHFDNNHTLRTVLNDEAKQPNFAKNIARDERARRKALESQLASVNTQLDQAIKDKNITLTQLQQLQQQTRQNPISPEVVSTINETNSIVKRIWDAITKLWRV